LVKVSARGGRVHQRNYLVGVDPHHHVGNVIRDFCEFVSCSSWNDKYITLFQLVRHAISNIVSIISRAIQELNRAVVWWTPDFIA
jgi:hypothetical protein